MAIQATAKDLVGHWRNAADKGVMNKNTALSLATACEQVMSVQDGWQGLDVQKIDVEDAITRFQHLRHTKFKPAVLATYATRFRRAVQSYLAYLQDPAAWRPKSRTARAKSEKITTPSAASPTDGAASSPVGLPTGDRALLMDYPFPLRPGVTVHLWLPRDLKRREIKRLTAYASAVMEAVASEDEDNTPG